MVVVVVVLALIAAAALVAMVVTRARLSSERAAAVDATHRAEAAATDSEAKAVALAEATTALDAASAQAQAAHDRAAQAEQAAQRAIEQSGIDADVLWTLERSRSERTWRFSVAAGPDSVSALRSAEPTETRTLLIEALRVELEAAREDVGTVVELEADIPEGVTTAGAVLALRAAQELLADVVRRSESTTLRVRAEGRDLEITVESVDEEGAAVAPVPLALPPSPSIEPVECGVRLHRAVSIVDADPPTDGAGNDDAQPEIDGDSESGATVESEPNDLDVTMEILYPTTEAPAADEPADDGSSE